MRPGSCGQTSLFSVLCLWALENTKGGLDLVPWSLAVYERSCWKLWPVQRILKVGISKRIILNVRSVLKVELFQRWQNLWKNLFPGDGALFFRGGRRASALGNFWGMFFFAHLSVMTNFSITTHDGFNSVDPSSKLRTPVTSSARSPAAEIERSHIRAQLNDLALARCSGGHGFDSCPELWFSLCPTLVTCWSIHLSHHFLLQSNIEPG